MSTESMLQAFVDGLAAFAPSRVVTRSFQDLAQVPRDHLVAGQWCVIANGARFDEPLQRQALSAEVPFLAVARFVLAEDAAPVEIERTELALVEEMKSYLASLPAGLCGIDITAYRQSAQLDHPYGWVACELLHADI